MASDQDLRDFCSTSQDYFNRRSSPPSDTTPSDTAKVLVRRGARSPLKAICPRFVITFPRNLVSSGPPEVLSRVARTGCRLRAVGGDTLACYGASRHEREADG